MQAIRDTEQAVDLHKLDGRTHITARYLCTRYSIPTTLFDQALEAVEIDGGQGALLDGTEQWIDAELFYELATSPELSGYFSETSREAMIFALRDFKPSTTRAVVTEGRSCA